MTKQIVVAPINDKEIPLVAEIYAEGFAPKFAWTGSKPSIVKQLFIDLITDKAISPDDVIVAHVDGVPAGMMILNTRTEVPPPMLWFTAWRYAHLERNLWLRIGLAMMVQVATTHWPRKDDVYISSLCVHTKYRNMGAAKALLTYAISKGMELGRRLLRLDVLPSNKVALHVYNGMGMIQTNAVKLDYFARLSTGENRILQMAKVISPPRQPVA